MLPIRAGVIDPGASVAVAVRDDEAGAGAAVAEDFAYLVDGTAVEACAAPRLCRQAAVEELRAMGLEQRHSSSSWTAAWSR